MKRIYAMLGACLLLVMAISSCNAPKPMDAAAMQKMADSIFQSKTVALSDSMSKDCTSITPIMVTYIADTIYNNKVAANAKK